MKGIFRALDGNIEQVDKRMDNLLTFIGIFVVFIVSKVFDTSLIFFMFLIMGLLFLRLVWDIIHLNSREQKRYR
ncbi:hypothetical protein JF544_01390 [Halobacillus kuroshimensis]|uniref:Uncharacterized protein n=2 Tax=Bacillaceae TaxID=186817 RepID=A0ABS3DRE5_9BACI|nr:hypothetical protein [Halobacillus kuroshimensis]MBN8233874.1 hypothetical protein [Halobacillus kuroshimensis]